MKNLLEFLVNKPIKKYKEEEYITKQQIKELNPIFTVTKGWLHNEISCNEINIRIYGSGEIANMWNKKSINEKYKLLNNLLRFVIDKLDAVKYISKLIFKRDTKGNIVFCINDRKKGFISGFLIPDKNNEDFKFETIYGEIIDNIGEISNEIKNA